MRGAKNPQPHSLPHSLHHPLPHSLLLAHPPTPLSAPLPAPPAPPLQPPRPSSMPGAAVEHVSTAVRAPPDFLQWHAVPLQCPKCTQCIPQHQQQVQQCMQGTYWRGWRRSACVDAKTRVSAVGALASTTCSRPPVIIALLRVFCF
jgi:hypothetical protein